jgi:soluble lytic murein transglycosylase-like protein
VQFPPPDQTGGVPAALPPVPKNRAQAQELIAVFELQMQQSLNEMSNDAGGTDGNGDGDGQSDDPAMSMSFDPSPTMLAALTPLLMQQQAQAAAGGGALAGATASAQAAGAAADIGKLSASARQNARVVADEARKAGVDPALAVAMMLVESGGNNRAVGDGGTSFGLFQLHKGGMLTAAGLTPEQAFDPRTNAGVAIRSLAHEWAQGHAQRSPGAIAAASQRPADPVGYAAKVDAMLARARALVG